MMDEVPYKGIMRFPSFDKFQNLRERTIGVQAYLDLIEMQLPSCLPDEIVNSDYIKQLYRLATRVFSWCNDFHSLLKDIGREPLNIVLVLENEYKLPLAEAHAMAMEMHNRDLQSICDSQKNIPDFGVYQDAVAQFVNLLGVMIRGQHEWYKNDTMRYKEGGYPEKDSFILP
jgi:hypothetical protein